MQKSHTVGISGCERERVSGLGRCARQGTRPWRLCDPGKEQSGVVSEGRFWERNAAWCESSPLCLPIKSSLKPLRPPLFLLLPAPPPPPLLFIQWVTVEDRPRDGPRWKQRLGYPSPVIQRLSNPRPRLRSTVRCSQRLRCPLLLFSARQVSTHSSFKCPHFCEDLCDPSSLPRQDHH